MLVKLNVHEQNASFIRALETFYPETSFNDIEVVNFKMIKN